MASEAASVERLARDSVEALVSMDSFTSWLSSEPSVSGGDLIVFNNSFVYRDRVKTTKSTQYLCITASRPGAVDLKSVGVAMPPSFNVDFKRFPTKSQTIPDVHRLGEAVGEQVSRIGRFVFLLIGTVDDDVQCAVPLSHALFSQLRFAPMAASPADITEGDVVVTNNLHDPEGVWTELQQVAIAKGIVEDELPASLESRFADAFERLQQEAYSLVRLPTNEIRSGEKTLLGGLVQAIDRQVSAYEHSLERCGDDSRKDPLAFADVLRIAYNFASDAGKLIDLIVSVCDLKPILLWCTIKEHLDLAEAFRNLPWAKSKKKPSLDRYEETIARARNRAFHDLIPFDRSMEVDVSDISLRAKRLRIFSPYSMRKTANVLEYEDQELVELLIQFTRAPETAVSFAFWKRNADVMRALQRLLAGSSAALVALRRSAA